MLVVDDKALDIEVCNPSIVQRPSGVTADDVPELPLVPDTPELPLLPLVPDVPSTPLVPDVPLLPAAATTSQ